MSWLDEGIEGTGGIEIGDIGDASGRIDYWGYEAATMDEMGWELSLGRLSKNSS